MKDHKAHPLPDAREDVARARHIPDTPQTRSPTHRLAFADDEFLTREALRPVRLHLELLKTLLALEERGIVSTVVMFGGARIPAPDQRQSARTPELAELSRFYNEARQFARMVERFIGHARAH